MSSCPSVDLNTASNQATWPKRLYIALIGPNVRGRRAVASVLKDSPNASLYEFDSYPPERGYLRSVVENPFNVIILELDSNVELALELIEEASKFSGAAVLAYTIRADSELTLRALQAGALAYSLASHTSELRQQVDRLADAYSLVEEDSETASQPSENELPKTEEHQNQITPQLPAVLPEGFDGWDDHAVSEIACGIVAEAKQILSPTTEEREQSGSALCSSPADTNNLDERELPPLKVPPAKEDQPFGPQTLNDTEEDKPHVDSSMAVEKLLKISTSKLWSEILFSGEKRRTQKFDSAQLRDADHALEEMFRRGAEMSCKADSPKRKTKIAAFISLGMAVILAIGLIFWSRPQPLIMVGQTVLQSPAITMMRTGVSTKAQRRQSTPANQVRLGAE